MTDPHNNSTPRDLLAIEGALDRLAAMDRASAEPGLEDRLVAATLGDLQSPVPIPIATAPHAWSPMRYRLAAAVLLAGGLVAILGARLAMPPAPSPALPNGGAIQLASNDVELWLTLRSPDEFQDLAEGLDLLAVDTETLSPPSSDWTSLLEPGSL